MNPIRPTPRTLTALTVCLLAVGGWQLGEGSWIYAKAGLAPFLLQRAWSRTLAGEAQVTPWPWADTWPVARLTVSSKDLDLIVLNGAYGRTLAFGPGYVEASAFPGSNGTTVFTGHRDTHFRFLQTLREGDELKLETAKGITLRYRVREARIADARTDSFIVQTNRPVLLLVTCYPFGAVTTGGPLRYMVTADGEVGESVAAPG